MKPIVIPISKQPKPKKKDKILTELEKSSL